MTETVLGVELTRHPELAWRRIGCVFCDILRGAIPADVVASIGVGIAFRPLNPVTDGHLLVIPRFHFNDALADPEVTGEVFAFAAALAKDAGLPCNLISSAGREATQSVPHLHVHIVPRRENDGLALPWTEASHL